MECATRVRRTFRLTCVLPLVIASLSVGCQQFTEPTAVGPAPAANPGPTIPSGEQRYAEGFTGVVAYVNEGPAARVPVVTTVQSVFRSGNSTRIQYRPGPTAFTDDAGVFSIPGWEVPGLDGAATHYVVVNAGGPQLIPQLDPARRPLSPGPSGTFDLGTLRAQRLYSLSATQSLTITLSNENFALISEGYPCDPCARVVMTLPNQTAARLRAEWTGPNDLTFGFSRVPDYLYGDWIDLATVASPPSVRSADIDLPVSWQAGATPQTVYLQVGLPVGSRNTGGFRAATQLSLQLSALP